MRPAGGAAESERPSRPPEDCDFHFHPLVFPHPEQGRVMPFGNLDDHGIEPALARVIVSQLHPQPVHGCPHRGVGSWVEIVGPRKDFGSEGNLVYISGVPIEGFRGNEFEELLQHGSVLQNTGIDHAR